MAVLLPLNLLIALSDALACCEVDTTATWGLAVRSGRSGCLWKGCGFIEMAWWRSGSDMAAAKVGLTLCLNWNLSTKSTYLGFYTQESCEQLPKKRKEGSKEGKALRCRRKVFNKIDAT